MVQTIRLAKVDLLVGRLESLTYHKMFIWYYYKRNFKVHLVVVGLPKGKIIYPVIIMMPSHQTNMHLSRDVILPLCCQARE